MNTQFTKIAAALALSWACSGARAQTYLLQEDFEGAVFPPTGWSVNTPPGNFADGWTYGPQPGLLSGICVPHGNRSMVSRWATYYPNNTRAYTPGLSLQAGTAYTLSFKQCVQSPSSNKTESLRITVGTEANESSQTLTLLDLPALTNTGPVSRSAVFTPQASGTYYFSFLCYSAANQRYLSIDSVSVYTQAAVPGFPSPYCANTFPQGTEPVSLVQFAGINNTSSASSGAPAHENYTALAGSVALGHTYPITLKGNTNGASYAYFKAYIDWNRNNVFTDPGEEYSLGSVYNSTGTDAVSLTGYITVPTTAVLGNTRMRIVKKSGSYATSPCNADGKGQSEDYTLAVTGVTSVAVATQGNVPAYITTDGGTLQMTATIYPLSGSQAVNWSIVPGPGNAQVSATGLVTAQSNGNVWAKAVSVADPTKKDSMQVTLINQSVPATGITVSTQGNVPATIQNANGSLQLVAVITPAGASQAVLWEILPLGGNAAVTSSGLVTPLHNGNVWARAKAVSNTSLRDSVLIQISGSPSAGVETSLQPGFTYYPNPARDGLTLYAEKGHPALTLTLMDPAGKTVVHAALPADRLLTPYTVDVSALCPGLYFMRLQGVSYSQVEKIIKE